MLPSRPLRCKNCFSDVLLCSRQFCSICCRGCEEHRKCKKCNKPRYSPCLYCDQCCHGCSVHTRRCKHCKSAGECTRCGCTQSFDIGSERICFCDTCYNRKCTFVGICDEGYCVKCCRRKGCEDHPSCIKCRSRERICQRGFCNKCCYGCVIHLTCCYCKIPKEKFELCTFGSKYTGEKGHCGECCTINRCKIHCRVLQILHESSTWTIRDLAGELIVEPSKKMLTIHVCKTNAPRGDILTTDSPTPADCIGCFEMPYKISREIFINEIGEDLFVYPAPTHKACMYFQNFS